MKTAIGIDIGGTKISMVVGNRQGRIFAHRSLPTLTGPKTFQGIKDMIGNIKILIQESGIKRSQIAGIGVGIPGPVDSRKGIVPLSPHLNGWRGIPLAKLLERQLGL